MSEETQLSEETRFWGVVVPRWPAHLWPHGTGLLQWPGKLPDGKPIHYYPLFSSKARAKAFVRERGQELMVNNRKTFEKTLEDIRWIYRDEIPDDYYVTLDGGGFVTWAELLAEGE
jgi:hypothetical protein